MRLAWAVPALLGTLCALAAACGEDEPLRLGPPDSVLGPGGGGGVAQAGAAGAATGGSTGVGGTDAASGGTAGSEADASVDAASDAANDAPADALGDAGKTLMPEFGLVDENTTSATYQQTLSPSYFKGQVSAWYFGHST